MGWADPGTARFFGLNQTMIPFKNSKSLEGCNLERLKRSFQSGGCEVSLFFRTEQQFRYGCLGLFALSFVLGAAYLSLTLLFWELLCVGGF